MIKVALLGNMNNNFSAITRYLRDYGYDAHLFYIPVADHFKPLADSLTLDLDFVHEVNWLHRGLNNLDEAAIRNDLAGFTFFIGQGTEASLVKRFGYNMDIYFPYGSDIYKYAWLPQYFMWPQILKHVFVNGLKYAQLKKGTEAKYMRDLIREARFVLMDYSNEEFERKLLDLNLLGTYMNVPMPFIYLPQYQPEATWDVHWKSHIDAIRKDFDFVLVYHGRHEWHDSREYHMNEFTTKNTHHVIIGFAEFLKNNPSAKAVLATVEYGGDATKSKELVKELGIESNVRWLPKMYRKDLMYLLLNSDLGSGEFDRSYLTFGTIIEAMSMGKPVLHYRDDSLYQDKYPELYPLYNAREPEEIAKALQRAYDNPAERKQMGLEAQAWVKKYFIDKPLTAITEIIEKTISNTKG